MDGFTPGGDVQDDSPSQDDIELRAAEWVVRLGGSPLAREEREAFDAWLAADPRHARALEEAQRVWGGLDALKSDPGDLRRVVSPPKPPAGGKLPIVLAFLTAGVLAYGLQGTSPWIILTADHRTGPSETRVVALSDGSSIELDASSAVAIDFDARERRVRLLAGAVYVEARPQDAGESRPFVLAASDGTVTALGTRFAVEDVGDGAMVAAVEHRIRVAYGPAAAATLSPGEAVRYGAKAGLEAVRRTAPDTVAAWRKGMLVFRDAPLSEVVETLNRHRGERIVVVGSALAARRVSGVFMTGDLGDAVDVIAAELGARRATAPGLITLLY